MKHFSKTVSAVLIFLMMVIIPIQVFASDYPFGIEPIVKSEGEEDEFDLYIVHTNDVHGRIEPVDGSMGYAKLATLLDEARGYTNYLLLLDAGDVTHGTNLVNMFNGESAITLLNMMDYDAMCPGNHDFNYGWQQLVKNAELSEEQGDMKVLAANILKEDGSFLFQPYQIYEFNGLKICVAGLTTPDTKTKSHPKNTEGLTFWSDEIVDNFQAALDLAHEYADYLIILGHIGLNAEASDGITSDWMASTFDGIDLFVDGHSHTTLENGLQVENTLIVSTGCYLNNLGVVRLHVKDGEVVSAKASLIHAEDVLNPSESEFFQSLGVTDIPDDPRTSDYIDELNSELDVKLGQVVATIPEDLDGSRDTVRDKNTNLTNLVCEAITESSDADFTIINAGSIRASLSAGDVTVGDIDAVLPFTNTVSVCEITGSNIYDALEYGYRGLPGPNPGFTLSDLLVVYSTTAEAGNRIRKVYLPDKTPVKRDDTVYHAATNDFLAAGGDGFTFFGREILIGRQLNEVFIDYLSEKYPVK